MTTTTTSSKRILVTGSRDFTDKDLVKRTLLIAHKLLGNPSQIMLVHGDAAGLDRIAAKAAVQLGWQIEAHPAQWSKHELCWCNRNSRTCKFAGHRRNADMVNLGADIVLAFPMHWLKAPAKPSGSRGTWHCAKTAQRAGLPVFLVWDNHMLRYGDAASGLTDGPINITTGELIPSRTKPPTKKDNQHD